MLSAISKCGKLHFMLYKNSINADKLIDFMTHSITDDKKKIFLILDNLRVHLAKKVTAWLEEHKDRIELFYLLVRAGVYPGRTALQRYQTECQCKPVPEDSGRT